MLIVLAMSQAHGQTPVARPVWAQQPSDQEISSLRPARVVSERVPGGAALDCGLTTAGVLDDCKVKREAPEGYGFGAAALKAAALFRAAPNAGADERAHLTVTFDAKRVGGTMSLANYPVWTHAPTAAMVAAAYPAAADGAPGKAVVRCGFDIEGRATDCEVRSETPAGKGFGAAALRLGDEFVLLHEEGEAEMLPGIIADIPITFRKPGSGAGRPGEPHWLTELTPAAAETLFPEAAREAKVASGTAVADCLVDGDGRLTDCRSGRGQSDRYGFDEAALKAASLLVLSPWGDNGEPFAGQRLAVPVRLRLVTPSLDGKPVWLNRPTAKELEDLHPRDKERPGATNLAGGATLVCVVTATGTLTGCTIENEAPKGYDFGAAVLESAPLWRMAARTEDGRSTAGTKVRVPVVMPAQSLKP